MSIFHSNKKNKMKRRNFIETMSLVGASSILPLDLLFMNGLKMKNIGLQLFSCPKLLETDFRKGIELISQMGYTKVELFGPYTFSAPSAQERWKQVTPMLGFSGCGYFGFSKEEVKSILTENGITTPAVHTDLETLESNMEALGEHGQFLGYEYVGLPAIPQDQRTNLDDYKKMADRFNKIGENAKKNGLKFSYHNHGYGLHEMNGEIPLQVLLDKTDPNLVFLEMDIYWTTAGGADPVEYLKKYSNRYHLMHVKDMKEKVRFSGDGGDAAQWIELFPFMSTCGTGVLDLPLITSTALKNGLKHFFVEQDMVAEPETALKNSCEYLSRL